MQIIVEEMLASVNYLLEMNLPALSDMKHLVIRVKVLVLQRMMNGEVTEEVGVTATARANLHLSTLIGQPTRGSTWSLL